jgi:ABC-type branched-subunit amino acid transport system ATPase component
MSEVKLEGVALGARKERVGDWKCARRGGRCQALVVSEQILSFTMEIADRFLIMEKGEFVYQAERKNVDRTKIHVCLTT